MQIKVTSRTETRAKAAHELILSSQELLDLYQTMQSLLEKLLVEPMTEELAVQIETLQAFLVPFTMEKETELLTFIAAEASWSNL